MKMLRYAIVPLLLLSFTSCDDENISSFDTYRYALWQDLVDAGWTFDFVGTRTVNSNYPDYQGLAFDQDHQGTGGIETEGILEELDDVLSSIAKPDVVLLGIGGNDLLNGDSPQSAIDNINLIIDKLQAKNANVTIFLEQIAGTNPIGEESGKENLVVSFNALIPEVAVSKSTPTSQIIVVDMYTDFGISANFADDVHYNEAGAEEIASLYFTAMQANLSDSFSYSILPLGDSRVEGGRE